ncbi:MAG TPA: PAS domain S-box protein [Trichocoleus sp.]
MPSCTVLIVAPVQRRAQSSVLKRYLKRFLKAPPGAQPLTEHLILAVTTAAAASSYCQDSLPDVIVIDDQPHECDALTLLQELGQHRPAAPMPVLILTRSDQAGRTALLRQNGAQVVLETRRLNPEALYWAIEATAAKARLAQLTQLEETRQQTEAALHRSEAHNRAMLQALPDLIMRMTVEGRFLDFFTGGAVKTVLLPHSPVADNCVQDVFDKDIVAQRLHYLRQAVTTQTLQVYEQNLVIDGQPHCEEVRIVPCGGGEALVVVRDTTERQRAEAALRRSEEKNGAMLRALPDLIMRVTAEGRYLDFFNGGAVRVVPLPHPVVTENWAGDGLPPDLAEQRLHYLRQAVESRELQIYEQAVTLDQKLRCEEVRIVPCGDDEAMVIVRDITERKQAELTLQSLNQALEQRVAARTQELAESNRKLRLEIAQRKQIETALRESQQFIESIADSSPNILYIYDLTQHGYAYINRSVQELMGYTPETVLWGGLPFIHSIIHPKDLPRLLRYLRRMSNLTDGAVVQIEYRVRRADGQWRWLHSYDTVFKRDSNGKVTQFVGTAQDVTERQQAEAQILRYRKLQNAIFSNATDALFLVDAETTLTFECNDRAVEMFEADRKEDLLGVSGGELLQKRPFTAAELETIKEDIRRQGFWIREVEYVTLKGRTFWGNLAARALSVEGEAVNLVRVTDITERKRNEEKMQRTLQREKELSDLKSRFISMTSHEFRTPLAVIASSAGILKTYGDRIGEAKKQEHLQTIQTYVRHTTELLDDILLINRAESDKLAFNPTQLALVEFCQSLTRELQLSTEHPNLGFTADVTTARLKNLPLSSAAEAAQVTSRHGPVCYNPVFDDGSSHDIVCMDKKLLRQILINLLVNAVKYSPESTPVQFTLVLDEAWARFEVADWGLGIPPDDLDSLFEAFHRGTNVGEIQGTGLGLSVVKKCVELHQGSITVASLLGYGTTFTVVLPRYSQA